MNFKEKSDVPE